MRILSASILAAAALLVLGVARECVAEDVAGTAKTAGTTGTTGTAEAPVQAGAADSALVPLTRDGALVSAMLHNRGVQVGRFGPRIGETYVPEARAAFDPVLLATVSYGRQTTPNLITGIQNGTTATTTTTTGTSGGGTSDPVANAITLINKLSRLNNTINGQGPIDVETKQSGATASLTNKLPTGASVFITGTTNSSILDPGNDRNTGDVSVGLTQPLLKGMGLKANLVALHQARNLAEQSEHAFRQSLLETAGEVELGYWQLVLAGDVLKIREFAVTLANEQVKRTKDFLEVGKAIRGDVMAAQADSANRRADLATAVGDFKNRNIDLVRLMNPDNAPNWDAQFAPQDAAEAVAVQIDAGESAKAALEHRPELAEAGLNVANLDLDVVRERNNRLPRLDLTGTYGHYSAGYSAGDAKSFLGSDRYDHYNVGIQFEMPLPRRAEKARYARAKLASAQGAAGLRQLEDAITAEARQAAVTVQQLWQRLAATREAVESRVEELRIAQGRYEVGKVTNLDVLQVQRDLISSQVDDATARVGYLESLTRLYSAEGTLLDRRGISVEQYAEEK